MSKLIMPHKPKEIREHWDKYKDVIVVGSPEYEYLWEDFEKKFNIDIMNRVYKLIKRFVRREINHTAQKAIGKIIYEKKSDRTLIIKGLHGEQRKQVHVMCDTMGLHHESKSDPTGKCKIHFYVYIPENWLWEYSEKNPFAESDEYYRQRDAERIKKQLKLKRRKENISCSGCGLNGLEVEGSLYHSVYIDGIFCDQCLDTVSDGEGDVLNAHKFEAI